jgi:glycosyltransferase involved in cell wall biosynthesis
VAESRVSAAAAGRQSSSSPDGSDSGAARPRLLLVARGRYELPLDRPLDRKFAALEQEFELRVLASAGSRIESSDARFRLVPPARPRRLDGALFYLRLPARVSREIADFRPDAVLVQGTHETAAVLLGRRLARTETPVILDLHGDWRSATRLYGSPLRRLLDPAGDLIAQVAVRRADAIRTISRFTTGLVAQLGRRPAAVFPAYIDPEPFLERPPAPLPERAEALFVGVLERYKNLDGLVAAWALAAPRVPDATLRIVGKGRLLPAVEQLLADVPAQTAWEPELSTREIAALLDRATVLVLPSRSEGLPRVVIEAFCRGRGVVGSRAGGIPDLIENGENGLLVEVEDVEGLADALVRVLSDRGLAERLGAQAREDARRWIATPAEYARSVRVLVDRARIPA